MKNILKSSLMAFLLIAAGACSNDDDETVPTPSGGPSLIAPEDGREFVLSPDNQDDILATFIWEHSNFGVGTMPNYTLELAKAGTDFADPIEVGTTGVTDRFLTVTVKEFNDAMAGSEFTPFAENEVNVRIKSSIGTANQMVQYSNVLTLLVTPYSDAMPLLAVPGNHQGWSPATAPLMASPGYGETNYEGYMWLDGGYKFLKPNAAGVFAWPGDGGGPDYGDNGDFAGILAETGESDCTATAGYYFVKADTGELTYSATPSNWAITGSATPAGWPDGGVQDIDMTYNPTTKKWEIIIALSNAGAFKFRANDNWDVNLGTGADGLLSYGGPDLTTAASGTYKVELDLSNPRQYTYTLTPQ